MLELPVAPPGPGQAPAAFLDQADHLAARQSWGGQPHTLAQFARRAGISEGRARALYAQPSGLPQPDRTDADGRPLWWAATIDAWCFSTGRAVQAKALWIHRALTAQTPPVELQRGMVKFAGHWDESLTPPN